MDEIAQMGCGRGIGGGYVKVAALFKNKKRIYDACANDTVISSFYAPNSSRNRLNQ